MAIDPIAARRAKRKEIELKGSFKIKDDLRYKLHLYREPVDLTLTDVSTLGCGFTTAYYLPKGLVVLLRLLDFPALGPKGESKTRDMEFSGRVMICKTTPSRVNKVGVEFVDIKEEDFDIIRRYIEAE